MSNGSLTPLMGSALFANAGRAEAELKALLASLASDPNPSSTRFLEVQAAMNSWSLTNQLSSTCLKSYFDVLKDIVNKV